ncbi:MAG: phage head closure protein [Rhodobacteraceae bacterium]|nr:phage head closure protein [Paracoccaceae bacterium]
MTAGKLDRRVQFRRYTEADDGYSSGQTWADHGGAVYASKTDLSDGEKSRAGETAAWITTRFVVRHSSFSSGITPKDRLVCAGVTYEISGIKEGKGRRRWLEITCGARTDL